MGSEGSFASHGHGDLSFRPLSPRSYCLAGARIIGKNLFKHWQRELSSGTDP